MRAVAKAGLVALALTGWGCVPEWAENNQSGLFMEIAEIDIRSGPDSEPGEVLYSDVSDGFNDDAVMILRIYRMNPRVVRNSQLEHIQLVRYEVRYFRTDGRNREGIDVPYRFTGPLNESFEFAPETDDQIDVTAVIPLVRHQAKFEPPLSTLRDPVGSVTNPGLVFGGPGIISTIAEITVHARQITTGEGLTATSRVEVVFADFLDE
jgi:hypothetical protein